MKNKENYVVNRDISKFSEEGYVVLTLKNIKSLNVFIKNILNTIRKILNNKEVTLKNFHAYIKNEDEKINIQYQINNMIWNEGFYAKILLENIDIYNHLIGEELDIQTQPHFRIARPNCYEDNIGFHKDIFYGNSLHERTSFIPLVNLDHKSALRIVPKSHTNKNISYKNIKSDNVVKGDIKHQLGFIYAPKVIDKSHLVNNIPIALQVGEVLIFSAGLIHGQEVNSASYTRFSIDIRVKNSLLASSTKEGYYKSFLS